MVFGYLLGSFPSARVFSRLGRFPDPSSSGSGNPGATNTIRVAGLGWGLAVFGVDALKGALAVVLVGVWNLVSLELGCIEVLPGGMLRVIALIAAVLGHVFPVFARFRGGKGVACAAGALVAIQPLVLLCCLGVFALVLVIWGMVSLASMVAALALLPCYVLLGRSGGWAAFPESSTDGVVAAFLGAVALLVVFLHRRNIRRITRGEESRFDQVRIFHRLGRRISRRT